ncbi:MAG: malate synthase A [Alphaproteobacteria bacterium]|nr:malate synthase A [Alphaproteobacteria bacterium]
MQAAAKTTAPALTFTGNLTAEYQAILTPEVQAFVAELAEKFTARRNDLLAKRVVRQARIDAGELPDFRSDTKAIRDAEWKVAPIPPALQDRRVEITGPVERKMIINALNCGAKVFMADFEDSLTPSWTSIMDGQINLRDYADGTISYTSPEGKEYKLNETLATLIVRPRGWHLDEKHVLLNGTPIPGALLDFGVYFMTNSKKLLARNLGPYFYLPKLESAEEAALWADIFAFSEERLGLAKGTIKATMLIETILATFEMDEILHALKDYCVGLNCGRWDYIFSFIKKFHKRPDFVLPERGQVVMTTHFLRTYSKLLIQTCHRRGAFAMGGMSAFIPVKGDDAANEKAFAMVRADKEREAGDGHDGTWVAHPNLVPVAMEVFNRLMPTPNQVGVAREPVSITATDLLAIPEGTITEAGLRNNISVSVQYLASWLNGNGCVPIFNLMEDAATAEIARSQIWQWIHHDKGVLADGRPVTGSLYEEFLSEELAKLSGALPYERAAMLLTSLVSNPEFIEFLTLPGYEQLQ